MAEIADTLFQPLSGNAINPDPSFCSPCPLSPVGFNPSQETPLTQTVRSAGRIVANASEFQPLSGNAINPDGEGNWKLDLADHSFNPSQETPLTQTDNAEVLGELEIKFQPLSGNAINPD